MTACSLLLLLLYVTAATAGLQHADVTCVKGSYPPKGRAVPTYVVNLDLPPKLRWKSVANAKANEIGHLLQTFKDFLLNFGEPARWLLRLVDSDFGVLVNDLPAPFGDELKGVAEATGQPLGEIVLYNIFYELFSVCTSIIATDSSGKLYHGRNLDFGLLMGWDKKNHTWAITEALRPAIINLDFQKGGKTIYKAVNFAGYIGILTGFKPGVFTLTMNERFSVDGGFIGILKWFLGDHKGKWMGFLTRETLENATSYEDAKNMLSKTEMLAPAYFILGGNTTGQACIITRSRTKALDIWNMHSSKGEWYILETNYDHWKKPLFIDDRRTPAKHCMDKLSQKNVGFAGLFDVLSTKPVLNKETTYTSLMQVNSAKMETYLQYCSQPDCQWWGKQL